MILVQMMAYNSRHYIVVEPAMTDSPANRNKFFEIRVYDDTPGLGKMIAKAMFKSEDLAMLAKVLA